MGSGAAATAVGWRMGRQQRAQGTQQQRASRPPGGMWSWSWPRVTTHTHPPQLRRSRTAVPLGTTGFEVLPRHRTSSKLHLLRAL